METINVKYLQDLATECVNDIVQIITVQMYAHDRVATGKTVQSITTEVKSEGDTVTAKVFVPPYFADIERGSPPGGRNFTKFQRQITEWAKARNIISGDDDESRKIVGRIAHKIISEGTILWRQGGENVFSDEVNERLERFEREATLAVQTQINNLIHL